MDDKKEKNINLAEIYIPSPDDKQELDFLYKEVEDMIKARNKTYPQFNERTLIQFVDDSEKRVQGYVPTREEQGKEEWQSNVFNQSTRNKLKALVAGVASTPPDLRYKAVSLADGGLDLRRGGVIENLVLYSRNKTNVETEIFWEAWTCATQGTVLKYDGYLKTNYKRKFIKSYDLITGDMEFEEKEVDVNDECVDVLIPISELFIGSFAIHDIQEQPKIAWIRYLDFDSIEKEFGKYKNFKYVTDKKRAGTFQDETETFFYSKWKDRVENENDYEVIKYYNRFKDKYCITINGVLILSAPMLWGRIDKVYPFSKTIFEPFANKNFFYGNSLPNANMDVQDVINTLYNMSLDKTYRSMNPPLLAGIANKDLLEMENENIGMESTIYVQDVNQIEYQKIPGITDSEMGMIKWVAQGMDLGTSIDQNQQGIAGRGVTAREIVLANENAKKLKGIFFMFLTDLWIQKTKLRILNILTNYTQPKVQEIVGDDGAVTYKESFRKILVEGSKFPDGSTGTLEIQFATSPDKLPTRKDLDIEEEKYRIQGEKYEKIGIHNTYLDEFDYDVQVISESLYQKDSAEAQAVFAEKAKIMMSVFPQIYMANQNVLFDDFTNAYGEDKSKYNLTPPQPEAPIEGEGGEGGAPVEKGQPIKAGALPSLPVK